MKLIYEFKNGRSGSSVSLVEIDQTPMVLKTNVKHIDSYIKLSNLLPFNKPKIYDIINDNTILMEYIPGNTIAEFLKTADDAKLEQLTQFISDYIDFTLHNAVDKDYTSLIHDKQEQLKLYIDLDFSQLPSKLKSNIIHGDLTFDNMIYYENKFYLIDFSPTPFDSIYFDLNKLRQDLSGHWFLRDQIDCEDVKQKTNIICNKLRNKYDFLFNDEIYKFMLSRILPYLKIEREKDFILNEINSLSKKSFR